MSGCLLFADRKFIFSLCILPWSIFILIVMLPIIKLGYYLLLKWKSTQQILSKIVTSLMSFRVFHVANIGVISVGTLWRQKSMYERKRKKTPINFQISVLFFSGLIIVRLWIEIVNNNKKHTFFLLLNWMSYPNNFMEMYFSATSSLKFWMNCLKTKQMWQQ